jgi:signal transduction histidine kinase
MWFSMRHQSFAFACMLLALILLALTTGCSQNREGRPQARQGVIDCSGYDFKQDGAVGLDGEWVFYWNRLLAPGDFAADGATPEPTGYLGLPGSWKGFMRNGRPLDGTGQATFRLRLLPGPGKKRLALQLYDIQAAYRLWVNGEIRAASGVLGTSAETEKENRALVLTELATDGQPLNLLLQISNHHFRRGGVPASIMLANPDLLELNQRRVWGAGLFYCGSLLVMGVYHLVLYIWRKRDASPLFFGLYCLLWMGNFVTSDATQWVVHLFFPTLLTSILDRISLVCYIVSVPIGYRFFRALYPHDFSRFVQHLCDGTAVLFGLIAISASTLLVDEATVFCYATSMCFILYSIVRLYSCFRQGRDGALFILCGFIVLGVIAINDMLFHSGLIESAYLIQTGMFVFVLFQALALAQRFSNAFSAVENLSMALERKGHALQTEMDARNKLERKIVAISEAERRRISHALHDGLCQKLTGARLRSSVLAQQLAGTDSAADLSALTSLLDATVGDAYDLSRGLWPVEHDPAVPGPSLDELVRRAAASSGIAVVLRQERRCAKCTNPHATTLFRIAQEALVNAVKHAKANRITVRLRCTVANGPVLTVADDGIGRAAAARSEGGLGLGIMAYRARIIGAALEIVDGPEGGTMVTCTASCQRHAAPPSSDGPAEKSHDGR